MERLKFLPVLVLLCGCTSSSTPTGSSNNNNTTIVGDMYFQADLNGSTLTMVPGLDGVSGAYLGSNPGFFRDEGHAFRFETNPPNAHLISGKPETIVHFAKSFDTYPSWSGCAGIVKLGAMNFGNRSPYQNRKDGVVIEYVDPSAHYWVSDLGSADQSGSAFVVTQFDSAIDLFTSAHYKTKATFNCNLYDSSGASMKLTNGKFGGYTVIYN
jgi:uncharacterized protein YceK